MTWTWAEPFAGAAACALRAVGGASLAPVVSWMGGKRRLARHILDAMGVPDGPPSRVLLSDAGPWGWVWPLLLKPKDAGRVADVLRSWAHEVPSEALASGLWRTLAALPPAKDVHERAAQWLWLQARAASGVPVWWEPDRAAWMASDGRGEPRLAGQKSYGWRMGEEFKKARRGDRGLSQKGTARGHSGGLVDPRKVADRVDAIAEAFAGVSWGVTHGSALDIEVDTNDRGQVSDLWIYLDPPYVGATGYGWDMPRAEVLALARNWADAGAVVAVSEAEPLALDGWHHLDLTREGGKPEWLTLSRAPARFPERQGALFSEGA
jgi:hypothetical protein